MKLLKEAIQCAVIVREETIIRTLFIIIIVICNILLSIYFDQRVSISLKKCILLNSIQCILGVILSIKILEIMGLNTYALSYLFCMHLLLIMSIEDITQKFLSLELLILFAIVGIILVVISSATSVINQLLIGLGVFAILILLSRITKEAIGSGDSIILGIVCIYLGWQMTLFMLLSAMIIIGIIGIILKAIKKISFHTKVPFVPFLFMVLVLYLFV